MELPPKLNLSNLNKITSLFLCITCFNILLQNPSWANSVYICQDKDGNTIYTDLTDKNNDCATEPKPKTIKPLPTPNLKKMTPADKLIDNNNNNNSFNSTENLNNADNQLVYDSVTITAPQNNESVNRCGGTLDVNFNANPNLYDGDMAHLFVDGAEWTTTAGSTFTVTDLIRGEHNIAVKIMRNGQLVGSSQVTYFNFLRNCAN